MRTKADLTTWTVLSAVARMGLMVSVLSPGVGWTENDDWA